MTSAQQQDEIPEELRYFDNAVREYTVSALLFIVLYFAAYFFAIRKYEQRSEALLASGGGFSRLYQGLGDYFRTEYTVNRICVYICTFTLAVAFATAFLVPFSCVANEVRLHFPDSVYLAWLNSSLVRSLWNAVSLFSNACLFLLAPFAYFLVEAEGLASNPTARSSRSPLLARIYEAVVLVVILLVIVCGLAWLADAFWANDEAASGVDIGFMLLGATSWQVFVDLWNFHLPSLYSAVSFLAMCVSVTCTPRGFTIIVNHIFAPKAAASRDVSRRRSITGSESSNGALHFTPSQRKRPENGHLTLSTPARRLGNGHAVHTHAQSDCESESDNENGIPRRFDPDLRRRSSSLRRFVLEDTLVDRFNDLGTSLHRSEVELNESRLSQSKSMYEPQLRLGPTSNYIPLSRQFEAELLDRNSGWKQFVKTVKHNRAEAKPTRAASFWKAVVRVASRIRELVWTVLKLVAKLFILFITIWILIQVTNQLLLLSSDVFHSYLSDKTTSDLDSVANEHASELQFGLESYSKLGVIGESIAVACIFYILVACFVGLYSFSFMRRFEPVAHDTPISRLLLNCVLVLLVTCVLPIQARLLGLTSFSLLGHFAHVRWLRNARLVFVHNAVFAVAACLCFTNEYTRRFLRKLAAFLRELVASCRKSLQSARAACFRHLHVHVPIMSSESNTNSDSNGDVHAH